MPIDAPFTEITAVAPDIADILLSGTWKIAAAVYDEPALMLTFFNCKISFFNNVADSATVLSPTVNLIETPFDDVLAGFLAIPLRTSIIFYFKFKCHNFTSTLCRNRN